MNFNEVIELVRKKEFKPIYFLNGEEPYFIDAIVDFMANNILDESEKDFNQTIFYAKDTPPINVIDTATRLPMMAEKQVVIVKEAQEYKTASQWEVFENYFKSPSQQTVLVFAYKYKKFDKRSKVYKTLKNNALIFESEPIKEYQLAAWIKNYVSQNDYKISEKSLSLLVEFIGNDLSRIVNELKKLFILVDKNTQINEKHIEDNIGISKDYNVFELKNAILEKNFSKCIKIINYFEKNPKAVHITLVISSILSLYQQLFKIHFLGTSNPKDVAASLHLHPYVANELVSKKNGHPPKIISRNFGILREYDLMSKGVGDVSSSQSELMKELIFKLLH